MGEAGRNEDFRRNLDDALRGTKSLYAEIGPGLRVNAADHIGQGRLQPFITVSTPLIHAYDNHHGANLIKNSVDGAGQRAFRPQFCRFPAGTRNEHRRIKRICQCIGFRCGSDQPDDTGTDGADWARAIVYLNDFDAMKKTFCH